MILALLSIPSLLHADGWTCSDPDVIFAADLSEQAGTVVKDCSITGNTGTLNGGLARVIQNNSFNPTIRFSTVGAGAFPAQYCLCTRTVGEDITFADNASLDQMGKQFMVAITIQSDSFASGTSRTIFSYADGGGGNSSKGWHLRVDGNNQLVWGHIGINDYAFNTFIPDLKPHTICVWDNGPATVVYEFIDGKLDRIHTAVQAGIAGTAQMSICRRNNVGSTEWGGGVAYVRVRKSVTNEMQAKALASQYHAYVTGKLNQ